ncbi:MAG TPA: DUF4124 domain-containing protein [Gammaproteobacteria bacterium]|nr:DUF4124 domain-containing protein [Gammaproteobacteria bacterium]
MRRLVLKAVMMTVVIFGAVNYMAYLQTGRSLLPLWFDKTLARLSGFKESATKVLDSVKEEAPHEAVVSQVIYKWTDAEGVLQYTNTPPPEGVSAEVVKVDPNANLIQAVPVPGQEESAPVPVADAPANKEVPEAPQAPFPYSPEQIKKTMDDAKKAQQMMNEKMEKQKQILDSL